MTELLKSVCGTPDHPLIIGGFEIPCYVLENEKRVVVQSGMLKALGLSKGSTSKKRGGDRLISFVAQQRFNNLINKEIIEVIENPIKFTSPYGIAYGYDATILVDICDAVIEARKQGLLQKQQYHIADNAEFLIRSFAKVGIIALIDEVTGYEKIRGRNTLQKFLDRFLLEEQAKWIKTFPDEFFECIFKMKGWTWNYASTKKPQVIGHYINNFIYSRIAPQVLDELRKKNPITEKGYRKFRHPQFISADYGHPLLKEHLKSVIALIRASGFNWRNFQRLINRALPRYGETFEIQFKEDLDFIE